MLKPTIKAQERDDWRCSSAFIINFKVLGIQDLVEHLRWSFPCNSIETFNFLLDSKYISETLNRFYVDYSTLIWLDYWEFSTSFMSPFIQLFQKFILKKNSNNLMLKINRAYSRNLGQDSILVRKGTFLWKRALSWKSPPPPRPPPIQFLF